MANGKRRGSIATARAQSVDEKYRDPRNFESTLHQIRAWIDDDINARGYSGMTNLGVSEDMLVDMVPVPRQSVTGTELLEQTDENELDDLKHSTLATGDDPGLQHSDYTDWVGSITLADRNYVKDGAIIKIIKMIWGVGSQTYQNLLQYYQNMEVDRGTWLIGRVITEQDVANARAL